MDTLKEAPRDRNFLLFFIKIQIQMKQFILFISTILFAYTLTAQSGTIRGIVIDDDLGETVIGANVYVGNGAAYGTFTDIDGAYNLNVPAGTHTLTFSYTSYTTQTINEVVVKEGEVTVIDIRMKEATELIEEVVVTAKSIKNTESALLTMQKKSANVIDGVSAQAIAKSGDSDVGEAIKRVTGVTVEGGKNVYVRGLGDRYTKTILNEMELPSLDPDRNTIQIDLFPTNIVDNIVVYKTFTPDLAGDFTGGTVDIKLKDFPEQKIFNISASLGYNSVTSFNNQFLTYDSKSADIFGLGADNRALPLDKDALTPLPVFSTELEEQTRSFGSNMSTQTTSPFLNQSYNISLGNQINRDKVTLGYSAALGYKNNNTHLEDAVINQYWKNSNKSINGLVDIETDISQISTNEVLWNGLLNGSVKFGNTSSSLSLFHTQDGIKTASRGNTTTGDESGTPNTTLERHVLYYNQRSISNAVFDVRHVLPKQKLEFSFKASPSLSLNKEPDIRQTIYNTEDGGYSLNPGEGGLVSRVYRDLQEFAVNGKFDVKKEFKMKTGEAKIKGGAAYFTKFRDFSVVEYNFRESGNDMIFTGDPNQLFEDKSLYDATTNTGIYVSGQTEPSNTYEASQDVLGFYVMSEMPLSKKIKVIYGARAEKVTMKYTGSNQTGMSFDKETVLDNFDILPSMNLVYNMKENMNWRASYSRTLVRPSFKEKSIAQIYDAITNTTFIGNIDLEQTYINNVDLRWEYFFNQGEILSVSGFYKQFQDPIELVAYSAETPNDLQPRNVGDAAVIGVELEARKKLNFFSEKLDGLSLGTNISLIRSTVEMNETEYNARLTEVREGETIDRERDMQGQSPYIVNAYLNYSNIESGLEANLSYNIQGERLSIVGISRNPDIYESPFHSVNFRLAKQLGKDKQWRVSLAAKNLLNASRKMTYQSFGDVEELYRLRKPGMSFSLGIACRL